MKSFERFLKIIQRRIYDFLSTKYGIFIMCISMTTIFISIIQLSDSLVEYRNLQLKRFSDILKFGQQQHVSVITEDFYFDPEVDVVYTWVNGSDPNHLRLLKKYKNNEKTTNSSSKVKVLLKNVREKINGDYDKSALWTCFHKLCMQTNNLIVIEPMMNKITTRIFWRTARSKLDQKLYNDISIKHYNGSARISILTINNYDFNSNASSLLVLDDLFNQIKMNQSHNLCMGFYTIDCNLESNCVTNIERTFIAKEIDSTPKHTNLTMPNDLTENLISKIDFVHRQPKEVDMSESNTIRSKTLNQELNEESATRLIVFEVKENISQNSNHTIVFYDENNNTIRHDLYRANIAWDLGDPYFENFAENRFQDNDELKFSLRSLEKYANWIRNVYFVTNGQVPSWLNTSNPRVKLVTHEDIFPNKSHLPTFSSPAIESHIHRIKGLSKNFIYFNDDFILGKPIYLDDFYTQSNGYKFSMAWAIPGCTPKCPNSWISDGYCDKACNNHLCDFDGGDCNKTMNSNSFGNNREAEVQKITSSFYCAPGCSTTWLADKYCDNACNNLECAYDMGDCGLTDLQNKIPEFNLWNSNEIIDLPKEKDILVPPSTMSFYINFTSTDNYKVEKANYEDNKYVRKISIVNQFKILTILLMPTASTLNKTEIFDIFLQVNNPKRFEANNEYNIKLTVNLNSPNTTHLIAKVVENSTLAYESRETSTLLKSYEIDKNIEPVHLILEDSPLFQNVASMMPSHLKFTNDFIKEIYKNYYEYLNWSFTNNFLSEYGFNYKLTVFYNKLKDQITPTYNSLIQSLSLNDNDTNLTSDDSLNDMIHNLLFNSNATKFLNGYDKQVLINRFLNETNHLIDDNDKNNNIFLKFRKRKLLDTFADSLRYVNKLFNQIYGSVPRKVPSHMPHMINKDIMENLHKKFPKEFDQTSTNRFRSGNDMQYAFSYNYFVMNEIAHFNSSKLFDELDLNENGILDSSELSIINMKLSLNDFNAQYTKPSDMYTLNNEFLDNLNNCKNSSNDISKEMFIKSCPGLVEFLKNKIWNSEIVSNGKEPIRHMYKFEEAKVSEVKFIMIGGDPYDIEIKLNNLIRNPWKFICLNDNIDYKLNYEAAELKKSLKRFYTTLFPLRSSFEKKDSSNV